MQDRKSRKSHSKSSQYIYIYIILLNHAEQLIFPRLVNRNMKRKYLYPSNQIIQKYKILQSDSQYSKPFRCSDKSCKATHISTVTWHKHEKCTYPSSKSCKKYIPQLRASSLDVFIRSLSYHTERKGRSITYFRMRKKVSIGVYFATEMLWKIPGNCVNFRVQFQNSLQMVLSEVHHPKHCFHFSLL